MWARANSRGFTVVEVMIFLIVTSGLFAIAFAAFNGQQQRTQFTQSVRDFEQKMRDVANDAATGYFPSRENYTCTSGVNDIPSFQYSSTPKEQGKNSDCVFVGRVVHFGDSDKSNNCRSPLTNDSICDTVAIYTLAGVRQRDGIDTGSIGDSNPRAIHPDNTVNSTNFSEVNATEIYQTKYNSNIKKVLFIPANSGSKQSVGAIGFMNSFDGDAGLTLSGSSSTEFYRFPNVELGQGSSSAIDAIEQDVTDENNAGIGNGAVICFQSDYNGQWGAVTIGANGGSLTTQSIFEGEAEEVCDV